MSVVENLVPVTEGDVAEVLFTIIADDMNRSVSMLEDTVRRGMTPGDAVRVSLAEASAKLVELAGEPNEVEVVAHVLQQKLADTHYVDNLGKINNWSEINVSPRGDDCPLREALADSKSPRESGGAMPTSRHRSSRSR